ncbi:zinc finger HIT domain-containing protein 1 [Parasteatoda tepidariorum]|uniref:Zinc finger HIT domain-containing protein 1 n=1 Tax=Parasteatoda tepidariorum TaxID=114398 RepID=A0A2L2YDL6_PARTP|nr:zinc finger HIT domain-containing protein 1-like [Parasteatoda tepidariorum]
MADKRESSRVKESNQRKVMDEASRRRRIKKALEVLEQDNFHDDPHANLVMHKNAPKFEETIESKKRRKLKTEPFKQRFRKNFTALLEDEVQFFTKDKTNYLTAKVPSSKYPERHFCAVCGFESAYTCVQCGTKFCSVRCHGVHQDTRCLKWTT